VLPLLKSLNLFQPKSCLDFIPTAIIKQYSSVFSEPIADLANPSFSQGAFPSIFKHASVTPHHHSLLSLLKLPLISLACSMSSLSHSSSHHLGLKLRKLYLALSLPLCFYLVTFISILVLAATLSKYALSTFAPSSIHLNIRLLPISRSLIRLIFLL